MPLVHGALAGRIPAAFDGQGLLVDRHPAAWLGYLIGHVDVASFEEAIGRQVATHVLDDDARVRRAVVNFFRWRPAHPSAACLAASITHAERFGADADAKLGLTQGTMAAEVRECVGLVLRRHRVDAILEALKATFVPSEESELYLLGIGRYDPDWVAANAQQLLVSDPGIRHALLMAVEKAPSAVRARVQAVIDATDEGGS